MENKIKIDIKKKADSVYKIGDNSIKIKSWIDTSEVVFIVDETLAYFKKLIEENNSDAVALVSAFAQMDMLIINLATNLDVTDLDTDQVGGTGLFSAIKEKISNYDMIKNAVMSGISMVGNGMIIKQLGQLATVDEIEEGTTKLNEYMNGENSDKIKELVEIMLANNPSLANVLNDIGAKND